MDFDLTDEQEAIRRLVRDFAEGEVRPVPEEYGGGGSDNLSYALAIEELTRVDSSVAITVAAHTSLGTWPVYAYGSDELKAEWLPKLCSGERLGAFGLTEPEAGSGARHTRPPPGGGGGHRGIKRA